MKEIHISIFNPDNLRLNELYYKLNQYTAKVTADLFEPNMYGMSNLNPFKDL